MESSQSSTVRQEEKSRRVLLKGVWVNLEQDRGVSPGDWVEIAQWFELVETLKGHQVQPPCNAQGHPQLHQCSEPLQPALGCLEGWGSTSSLGSLCQCLTTCIQHFPCIPAAHREPLPAHGGSALQVVGVADEFVQNANDLGEARPLAAVLLPAVQHQLVQGCGAAHRGWQAVAFLH